MCALIRRETPQQERLIRHNLGCGALMAAKAQILPAIAK